MSGRQPDSGRASQVFQPLGGDDPTTIAGYRLAARLGAGGTGKVYLSYTPGGRPVAIKVIRPEFGEDAEFRRRFTQEVQSAQRVQGLFTAPVIDAAKGGKKDTDSKPSTKPDPKPAEYKGINLTAGYHLTLGDDNVRPRQGEDGGYELSYDTGGYLDAETTGGSLVLLDPGQEGSLATCRAETRFTETIYLNTISKGRQICVTTGTGHMGLVTVEGLSGEDSPSTYMTLDLTVWRNAAGSGS